MVLMVKAWLKRVLCWHQWRLSRYHNGNPGMLMFRCNKCGKEDVWL